MKPAYHGALRAVTDPGPGVTPTDIPYKPPAPGTGPATPPTAPVEEPPLPPAGEPGIGEPPPTTAIPSPITL